MMTLRDGPARGSYAVKRAPRFLRAVVDGATGKADVLDQLDDTPAAHESIYVYRIVGQAGSVHLNFGSRSGRSGFYVMADYEHLSDVDGESFRNFDNWREWCIANKEPADEIPA